MSMNKKEPIIPMTIHAETINHAHTFSTYHMRCHAPELDNLLPLILSSLEVRPENQKVYLNRKFLQC